jgi:hypothetical protein
MNLHDKPEVAQAGAQLLHPGSRILFRHWETVRAERPCPNRTDISLRAISKLLPFLAIIETGQNINSPIFKLAGTAICELFQSQLTGTEVGLSLDQFERRVVNETLIMSLQRLQPSLIRMRFVSTEGFVTTAEFLALPVFNQALGVTQLFCGVFAFAEPTNGRQTTLHRIELIATRMIWTEHQNIDLLLGKPNRRTSPELKLIQGGMSER